MSMIERVYGKIDRTTYFVRRGGSLVFGPPSELQEVQRKAAGCECCKSGLVHQLAKVHCGYVERVAIPRSARDCLKIYAGNTTAGPADLRRIVEEGRNSLPMPDGSVGKIAACGYAPHGSDIVLYADFAQKAMLGTPFKDWAASRGLEPILWNGCPEFFIPMLKDYDVLPEYADVGMEHALEVMKSVDHSVGQSFDFGDLRRLQADLAARGVR